MIKISQNEILTFKNREEFYKFLKENHNNLNYIYTKIKFGDPKNTLNYLNYIDGVEVALCFGWIDSVKFNFDGETIQKFTPRNKNSYFTELNKERCRRLIKIKDMDESGLKLIPNLNKEYIFPKHIIKSLSKDKDGYAFFLTTPKLYQNIKIYNLEFTYHLNKIQYKKSLQNLMKYNKNNKLLGQWNDYGRLLNY